MNKRTIEGEKGIIDYWWKNWVWGEELGEQTRVSAGNPFGTLDSTVKLSALAVESRIRQWNHLPKPWNWRSHSGFSFAGIGLVFSKKFIGDNFIFWSEKKEGIIFCGTCGRIGSLLGWAHSTFSGWRFPFWLEHSPTQTLPLCWPCPLLQDAACSLVLAAFSFLEVAFSSLAESPLWLRAPCWPCPLFTVAACSLMAVAVFLLVLRGG